VLGSGQTVFVIARRSRRIWTENGKVLRDFCGTLLCSPVLDNCNGRPAHRFSINSSPTESNSCHTALYARFAAYAAGQPLQGECQRFDPVSTSSSWKQRRARSAGLHATIHSRAREICGNLCCTSMHFQALSCNGRVPKSLKIRYLASTDGAHNAEVVGSRPTLATKSIKYLRSLAGLAPKSVRDFCVTPARTPATQRRSAPRFRVPSSAS
jgi:hypothetical protein